MLSDDDDDVPLGALQEDFHPNQDASQDTDQTEGDQRQSNGSDNTFEPDVNLADHPQADEDPANSFEMDDDLVLPDEDVFRNEGIQAHEDFAPQETMANGFVDDDDDDDDEDNLPLSAGMPSFSRMKKSSAHVEESESDSDDIPLSQLKKPPARRSAGIAKPPPKRKTPASRAAPKKEPQTKSGSRKQPAKRKPRTKKEEEGVTAKYEKRGQRKETPPDNDSSRLFYQSMWREKHGKGRPSQVADCWMLRHGLLEDDEIEETMHRWGLVK